MRTYEKSVSFSSGLIQNLEPRGSAAECASCLDALVAKNICTDDRIDEGKELLQRIVSILTKLIMRFSPSSEFREEVARYRVEDEYEHDDEYDD